ncbi:hypothetical protein HJB77_26270 [Rhizobium lentis]|uniref:hypothetical protein n=1 Tax=Rhizobium lentis TaxID=1138194 RepID=UPI001C83C458|nr:hypothetical protein [Rhizobium lentis]MBX5179731.1 hypothetical protein [Rhizobium lentis]
MNQRPFGPEREALVVFLEKNKNSEDTSIREDAQTPSLRLAEEYLRLGGRRRVKVDDNIVSTRKWDDEPAMVTKIYPLFSYPNNGVVADAYPAAEKLDL